MVYRRKRVTRTLFRKLPVGALYWLSDAVGVAPSIKTGRRSKAGAFSTDNLVATAVADTSVAVVRVPNAFVSIVS